MQQDGLPTPGSRITGRQLVEELFPLDISQLFFFDAEKIRTLAEDESSSKALEAAIKSLLGLDIVERLITDSVVLQGRLARRVGSADERAQATDLERLIGERRATQRATLLNDQAKRLDDAITPAHAELKDAEAQMERLVLKRVEQEFAGEDHRRMLQLAERTGTTMQEFLKRVTARKIDRLSTLITESFRFLLRKQLVRQADRHRPADLRDHALRRRRPRRCPSSGCPKARSRFSRSRSSGGWPGRPPGPCRR